MGYLPQDGISVKDSTLYEEEKKAFADALALREKLDEAEEKLGIWGGYGGVLRLDRPDGGVGGAVVRPQPANALPHRKVMVAGMGSHKPTWSGTRESFQGGGSADRPRKLLLQAPSSILDEPTNHLGGSRNISWKIPERLSGALVVISPTGFSGRGDRTF